MTTQVLVRFIRTEGFVPAAIARITGSLFDHAEFGSPEGTWIGAHAGTGVQERPANYCDPYREFVYGIPCTEAQLSELMAWARLRIGKKYNYLDIAGLLFQDRALNNPNRLICSQFVADGLIRVFGAGRVLNVLPQWTYRITPESLHLSPIFVGNLIKKKEPS